jgi:D-aminopeptidase
MRIREMGVAVGRMATGPLNKISDVPGVSVGHCTLDDGGIKTGVTVVMPCGDNPFFNKLVAAAHVLNGFGKTLGLMQIEELGALETPIALTNTLSVGDVHAAMVEYMLGRCDSGFTSINPVVCECNDGYLNDIRRRAVGKEHLFQAIADARADFAEGDVGAGKGMSCHGLKGGVGSASRIVPLKEGDFTVGVLTLTNHGRLEDLRIDGAPVAQRAPAGEIERGSCIAIVATDLPLTDRQLYRAIRRACVGLVRLGSFIGHGSGEVIIGFSTANRIPHESDADILPMRALCEDRMDLVFRAVAEATEEAILNSMAAAGDVTGYRGHARQSLATYLKRAGTKVDS